MAKPAGYELKRWFIIIVVLLAVVNVTAVAGAVISRMNVVEIAERYQPFQESTTAIASHLLAAQRDMYEYLSELSDSPQGALDHLDAADKEVAVAEIFAPNDEMLQGLGRLKALNGQYRKAVEQLPSAMEGTRDWSRLEELRNAAIRYGGQTVRLSSAQANWTRKEIKERIVSSSRLASLAMWGLLLLFIPSVAAVLALRYWWIRFQEVMLGV